MSKHQSYYHQQVAWHLIPEHMHSIVIDYVMKGAPLGGFLGAVFKGDGLLEVAGRADEQNLAALSGWAKFLYNYVPANCKGSPEAVAAWQAAGGIEGGAR